MIDWVLKISWHSQWRRIDVKNVIVFVIFNIDAKDGPFLR